MFEVTAEQIELLNDTDLRALVGLLCEQELRTLGYSPAAVTSGGNQNAKDGGIDVRVDLPDGTAVSGFIPASASGFQVKAQDMPRGEILDEMAPKNALRPSIADLASRRGAYIIVSSQGSLADSALQDRKSAMRAALNGAFPADALIVDFYDRHRLATWVNQHPGLVPWVREKVARPLSGWRAFGDWSSSPTSLDKPYLLDDGLRLVSQSIRNADGLSATNGVNCLRRILEKPKGIVRLVGLSGIGKTRLVQALFDERIGERPLAQSEAIYADISDSPDPVPLELASQLITMRHRAVMIVDNCGIELHRKLSARIMAADSAISVITVEYDVTDDEPENTDVFKLEAASVELIEKILEAKVPGLAGPSRSVIAQFSDGNARIALALAATAKSGESLANLRDTELFRRLFEQSKGASENLLSAAKACALLYSFDGETLEGESSELITLASLAGCTVDQLFAHVAELGRRQLVQKRSKWRAILPHALAHRLAKIALQDIPFQRIEAAIVNGRSERMLRSFSKRMGYLHDDNLATALAAKWLTDGGLLEPIGNLDELGAALLTNVAPIQPEATLASIERAAARHPWFFGSDNRNRREIVRIIRSIAYDATLFDRAVALLGNFAVSEGESQHDSSKNVLKSLFFLYLSGTHAAPFQRAAYIKQLLESANDTESALGLELLRAMLECRQFSSHYPFEFGARTRDFGLYPRKRNEFVEWFGQAMRVVGTVGASNRAISHEVRKLIAVRFSELCKWVDMIDELVALAETFAGEGAWPEGWIGTRSAVRKCKGTIEESKLAKLEALSERLRPKDLPGLVRSYALSKEWGPLDIAVPEEDEEEETTRGTAREKVFEVCVDLGQQLAQDSKQLSSMLPEILASDSQKTFALGKGVASGCASLAESWRLLVHHFLAIPEPKRRPELLAGFLASAMARNADETEGFLDEMLADARMHTYFVYCQGSAEFNDAAYARLVTACALETVPVSSYTFLAWGRSNECFNDEQICELLRVIAAKDDGMPVAVEILGMRVFSRRSDRSPVGETLKAAGRDLLEQVCFEKGSDRFDHLLGNVIEVSLDDSKHEELARSLCTGIVAAVNSYRISAWDINDIIEGLAKTCPVAVLDILVEQAKDAQGASRAIFRDIRENRRCALQCVPDEVALAWAAAKPDSRYIALAGVVKYSDANDDEKSLHWSVMAEKIMSAAPDPATVLDVFLDRFPPTGGWSGSLAGIMASRIPLIELLAQHTRPEVAAWATANLPKFTNSVERRRAGEAAQDRRRDERFE